MQREFVLQILSSTSDGLTVMQLQNCLSFLGVNERYKDSTSFNTSLYQILDSLIKSEYVSRRKDAFGEYVFSITPRGWDFLQSEIDLELTKSIINRVS